MNDLEHQVSGYNENYVEPLVPETFSSSYAGSDCCSDHWKKFCINIVSNSFLLHLIPLSSFCASTSEARFDRVDIPTHGVGTKRDSCFGQLPGGLSFTYIADDGPKNFPSRVDMIGQWSHISEIRSACRISLG